MGLPEVMEHIQGLVDGVAGTARCHLGMRRFAAPEYLLSAGQDPAVTSYPDLHLWFAVATLASEERLTIGSNLTRYTVQLDGYRQARDPTEAPGATEIGTSMTSEIAFSAEVESIRTALRNSGAIHGGSLAVGASPPQRSAWDVRTIDVTPEDVPASDGELLECHYAQITLTVDLEVPVTLSE